MTARTIAALAGIVVVVGALAAVRGARRADPPAESAIPAAATAPEEAGPPPPAGPPAPAEAPALLPRVLDFGRDT